MPKGEKTKLIWEKQRVKMMQNHKVPAGLNKIDNWIICITCEKRVRFAPSLKRKFCSKECYIKSQFKENPSYSAIHKWVYKNLGKAKICSNCSTENGRVEWANISREYKRDLTDWMQLCIKCHKDYDGHGRYWLGKTFSLDHRNKLSISHKKYV